MNFLKKGPELKLSKIKVPGALRDLFYDLDDRHLLPVVAVLLIAIVAVPLLLAGSSESQEATPEVAPITSAAEGTTEVAKATPRLRDYKRRLGHLRPRNPFVAQGSGNNEIEVEPGESSEGSEETPFSPEETTPETITPESGGGETPTESETGNESSSPATTRKVTYFSYAIDVRVVPVSVDGKKSHEQPTIRKNLPPLVMLPSREIPALTFVATSKDHKKAVMLVSADVTALFGDAKCVVGSESCQLLALEEGVPETVVYGPAEKTFRIELRKLGLVETESLNVDPLGEPEKGKNEEGASGSSARALERLVPAAG